MIIYGNHACRYAVEAGRKIYKIYLLKSKPAPQWMTKGHATKVLLLENGGFEQILPKDAVHQGIAMEVEDTQYADITELEHAPRNCAIAILDGVTDPHNMGAIIRSAVAFGITSIIIGEKSSCKINGIVAKSASGGIEHIKIIVVKNLSQTIKKLKDFGFWVISFCERGEKYLHEMDLTGKTCLIFGSEGDGIRRLQKENSDFIVKLPTSPSFPTLNVSSSSAIVFYETSKQNNFFLSR